jgi:hypothetical protein
MNLQISTPFQLKMIAEADWPDAEERAIHSFLDASHHRGEWFRRGREAELVIGLMRDGQRGLDEWLRRSRQRRCLHRVRAMQTTDEEARFRGEMAIELACESAASQQ